MPNDLVYDEGRIKQFIDKILTLSHNVVLNPVNIVSGRFHRSLVSMWPEVATLYFNTNANSTPRNLDNFGLTGQSLNYKLEVFEQSYNNLLDHAQQIFWFDTSGERGHFSRGPEQVVNPEPMFARPQERARRPEDRDNGFWAKLRYLLGKCCSIGGVLIDSLSKAWQDKFEPIKEFLGFLGEALEVANDAIEKYKTQPN